MKMEHSKWIFQIRTLSLQFPRKEDRLSENKNIDNFKILVNKSNQKNKIFSIE